MVDDNGGMTSSRGLYRTDENGQIMIDGLVGTFLVTETKTIEGYTIHEETRTQTVVINPNDTQTITVYNDPIGGVEIIKVNADDTRERIPNTTFEIRRMDDALVDTVTTDKMAGCSWPWRMDRTMPWKPRARRASSWTTLPIILRSKTEKPQSYRWRTRRWAPS